MEASTWGQVRCLVDLFSLLVVWPDKMTKFPGIKSVAG